MLRLLRLDAVSLSLACGAEDFLAPVGEGSPEFSGHVTADPEAQEVGCALSYM